MKKFTIFCLSTLLSFLALSQSVPLTWDASPSPGLITYRLYAHTNNLATILSPTNALVRVDVGTNRLITLTNIMAGTWYFGVKAADTNGIESLFSNILVLEVPKPPPNLRSIIVQWNGQIASTNWIDAIYLKLKIGN